MINQDCTNGISSSDTIGENKTICNNNNSKTDIQANNYNKSKVFDMNSQNLNIDLSRVDSQNYPDATENLDYIANKMGLNQTNNNKPNYPQTKPLSEEHCPETVHKPSDLLATPEQKPKNETEPQKPKNETEPQKPIEHHKKVNIVTKFLRRLSKPSLFSKKEKKQKNSNTTNKSVTKEDNNTHPDSKVNTVCENNNQLPPRSRSFRKMFGRLGKGKQKPHLTSEVASSVGGESRPSVSSTGNTVTLVDCVGSCNDMHMDKVCMDELGKYTSPSVDCILDHRVGRLLKQQESESSNSEDLRDHERKMNDSNTQVVSIFCEGIAANKTSRDRTNMPPTDEDKLSPLNVYLNLASYSVDDDRSCHSAMSAHTNDTSSNVKLTLSLHGYSNYGLSSSRFNSKSCMEFGAANISSNTKTSMDNIANAAVRKNECDELICTAQRAADCIIEDGCVNESVAIIVPREDTIALTSDDVIVEKKEEEASTVTDVLLRKSERPTEIQLRKSRAASQTSMARSSLIMVAVSHNSPRTKGIGNCLGTPIYNPDSPNYPGRKLDFEEDVKAIEEEKSEKSVSERNGNDFLLIVNQYESEINVKIETVEGYLELWRTEMDDDVIGELSTAVGLAKLLLKEKFVQFRGLCEQNINGSDQNEFQTLICDLEGYLLTLELQIADLNKNFGRVEKIRENRWRMPLVTMLTPQNKTKKKIVAEKAAVATPEEVRRTQESRRRLQGFKKTAMANKMAAANIFVVEP